MKAPEFLPYIIINLNHGKLAKQLNSIEFYCINVNEILTWFSAIILNGNNFLDVNFAVGWVDYFWKKRNIFFVGGDV
jgi:hypothetical protein